MFHKYSFPCIQNIYPPGGTLGVAEEAEVEQKDQWGQELDKQKYHYNDCNVYCSTLEMNMLLSFTNESRSFTYANLSIQNYSKFLPIEKYFTHQKQQEHLSKG